MKKLLMFLFLVSVGFWFSGAANATPFEIGNGGRLTLSVNSLLFGSLGYTSEALSSGEFNLSQGDSRELAFFDVTFNSFFGGEGDVEAVIQLLQPEETEVGNGGDFWGITGTFWGRDFQFGNITWGDPVTVAYGNGGSLSLGLHDLSGLHIGNPLRITGTITNNISGSPTPTPEPATMFLVGIGLIGLAGFGRRKLVREEKKQPGIKSTKPINELPKDMALTT